MEEHVFGINFLDRDIPGRRVGTFQSEPVVIKTVPERSNFSAKWSRGIGTGCVYSAHVRIPYRWLRRSPTAVSSWKIVFKGGGFFFHSFPSFFLSSFFPKTKKKERETLYSGGKRRSKFWKSSFAEREKGWFHARDIKVRPRKKTPILVIVPSLLQIHG